MPNINTRNEYNLLPALNYSGAKELLKSPAHFKSSLTAEREETKALRMGSLTHALVLEKDTVLEKYAASPECDRRTKEGKQLFEIFQTANAGKTIVAKDEWETCDAVAGSMLLAVKSLGVKFVATELMLTTDYCGAPVKSAIDAVGDDGYIYDLKTSEDASEKGFMSSVRAYRYNLQAHFYRTVYQACTGERVKGFRFIVAEKSAPYAHAVYELGPELMTYAVNDFEKAVSLYKSCVALDEWPGYGAEPKVIDINAKSHLAEGIKFA